jgi:glycosyltransferase involved in cell wall biosynthesis
VHVTTADMSLALLLGPQLRALRDAGYDVIGASAPGPYVPMLHSWGIEHLPLRHVTRAVAPLDDLQALPELYRLFRRLRPDVVHTHNPKPGVYGRLAARAAGVGLVVNTVHGLYAVPDDPRVRRTVVYTLERLAAACSDVELVQNPEDLEVLAGLGVPRHKLVLLGNGVDLQRFRPPAEGDDGAQLRRELGIGTGEVLCGTVGRLVREKGFEELFAAAEALAGHTPPLRFVVAGPTEGDKGDGLSVLDQRRAQERAGVLFLGRRDDVERVYRALDVFVLASHREGFPRAAMEAAASGVPVVATDIRGCRQVVEHGVTGLLVPVRSPRALATAIATLAADGDLRSEMGVAGRRKAEREFDEARIIETVRATYAQHGCGPTSVRRSCPRADAHVRWRRRDRE